MTLDNFYLDCLLKIGTSFACGILLGIERKSRQHTVGMRTLMLISVSSSVLTMMSSIITKIPDITGGDPTRIAAGIVTGIGFLGGGAIIQYGLNIRGLTSAAIIFTAAALGIACGTGQYFIAGTTIFIILFALVILEKVERKFFPAEKRKSLVLEFSDSDIVFSKIVEEIKNSGLVIKDTNMSESIEKQKYIIKLTVKAPGDFDITKITKKLSESGKLVKISISDI